MITQVPGKVRELVRLSIPVVMTQVIVMGNAVADTYSLVFLDPQALAGYGLGYAFQLTLFVTAMGVVGAVLPLAAKAWGKSDTARLSAIFWSGLLLGVLVGMIAAIGLWLSHSVFAVAADSQLIRTHAYHYCSAIAVGLPFAMCFRALSSFATAIKKTSLLPRCALVGFMVKIPLVLVFIETAELWGGTSTAACGFSSAVMYMVMFSVLFLGFRPKAESGNSGLSWKVPDRTTLRSLLAIGLPFSAGMLAEIAAFNALAFIVAGRGSTALAAHHVAANAIAFATMLPMAYGNVTGGLAGNALGRGNVSEAGASVLAGYAVAAMSAALVGMLGLATLWTVGALHPSSVHLAVTAAAGAVAAYHFASSMRSVSANTLRVLGMPLVPMYTSLVFCFAFGAGGAFLILSSSDEATHGGEALSIAWAWVSLGVSIAAVAEAVTVLRKLTATQGAGHVARA